MRIRLFYCGMRAINYLADLTNYLMLEMGQPMHAFDSRKVEKIRIKRFDKPFTFKTLDGVERNIDENTLMICNGNTPVAIAGIMGAFNRNVSAIFFTKKTHLSVTSRQKPVVLQIKEILHPSRADSDWHPTEGRNHHGRYCNHPLISGAVTAGNCRIVAIRKTIKPVPQESNNKGCKRIC